MTGVSPAVLFGLRCRNPHHPKSGEVYGINPEWQHLARLTNDGCSELVVSHDGGVTWAAAPRGGPYLARPSDVTVEQEAERLREHSVVLNTVAFKLAQALGDIPEGQHRGEGDPVELAERLIAERDQLMREGVDAMAERLVGDVRIRSMEIRDGRSNLDLEPSRELVAIWVGAARTMLGDAPNYTETRVDVPTDADPKAVMEVKLAGEFQRYAFTLQRVGKLTPHEARVRAEGERDEARGEIVRLTAELEQARAELQRAQPVLDAGRAWWTRGNAPETLAVDGLLAAVDTYLSAADSVDETPEPCQPIGCDNGHHLPGCVYAAVDAGEAGQP